MNRMVLSCLALAAACALCSSPLRAETGVVDQVESLDIENGESEVEFQLISVPSQDGRRSFIGGGITIERGVSDALALGVEVEFEGESGDVGIDEVAAQAKWVIVDPDDGQIGLGAQLSAGYAFEDRKFAMETVMIASLEQSDWSASANAIFSSRDGRLDEFDMRYAARFDRLVAGTLRLGLEAGGELASDDSRGHWLGPLVSLGGGEGESVPTLEIGAFAGLNKATPDVQFRVELDVSF